MTKNKFILLLIILILPQSLYCGNPQAVTQGASINTTKSNLKQIQHNIKDKQIKIKEVKKKETKINKELNYIKYKTKTTKNKINELDKNITNTKKEYSRNKKLLEKEEEKGEYLKKILASELRVLYKKGIWEDESSQDVFAEILFSDNLTKKDEKYYNFKSLLRNHDDTYIKIVNKQNAIDSIQGVLDSNKKQLQRKQNTYKKRSAELDDLDQYNQNLLTKVKKRRQKYEQELRELKKSATELQNFINGLLKKKKILPKRGNAKRYTTIINMQGPIPKPVSGNVITKFGKQKHKELDAYHISNGVEISSVKGNPVKLVLNGTIVFSGRFKTYGNMLIVDHNEGIYTVYAYLDSLKAVKDQKLLKGAIIGTVGYSPVNKTNALYFEVRLDGVPMDPMLWMK